MPFAAISSVSSTAPVVNAGQQPETATAEARTLQAVRRSISQLEQRVQQQIKVVNSAVWQEVASSATGFYELAWGALEVLVSATNPAGASLAAIGYTATSIEEATASVAMAHSYSAGYLPHLKHKLALLQQLSRLSDQQLLRPNSLTTEQQKLLAQAKDGDFQSALSYETNARARWLLAGLQAFNTAVLSGLAAMAVFPRLLRNPSVLRLPSRFAPVFERLGTAKEQAFEAPGRWLGLRGRGLELSGKLLDAAAITVPMFGLSAGKYLLSQQAPTGPFAQTLLAQAAAHSGCGLEGAANAGLALFMERGEAWEPLVHTAVTIGNAALYLGSSSMLFGQAIADRRAELATTQETVSDHQPADNAGAEPSPAERVRQSHAGGLNQTNIEPVMLTRHTAGGYRLAASDREPPAATTVS